METLEVIETLLTLRREAQERRADAERRVQDGPPTETWDHKPMTDEQRARYTIDAQADIARNQREIEALTVAAEAVMATRHPVGDRRA